MLKRRRFMLYLIGAQLLIIGVNLTAFLSTQPMESTSSPITGLVIGDGVTTVQGTNMKVVIAIIDAFILFCTIGIFLAIEMHRPHLHS